MSDPKQMYSIEAEEAVLGSCLIDGDAYLDVVRVVSGPDFYLLKHTMLWDALSAIYERNEAVDDLTVVSELRSRGQFEKVGGAVFLTRLINNTPSSLNAETYAQVVKRASVRRQGVQKASALVQNMQDEHIDVKAAIDRSIDELVSLRNGVAGGQENSFADLLAADFEYSERAANGDAPAGIPTGFTGLDEKLGGGLYGGSLTIIGARPKMGKTSLGLSMLLHQARVYNARCIFFTLEMPAREITRRIVSMHTGVAALNLKRGYLSDREWQQRVQTQNDLANLNIVIRDQKEGPLTLSAIRSAAMREKARSGLDIIYIDYIGLMTPVSARENRERQVAVISSGLKQLAVELDIPIVVFSQLNRKLEDRTDKRPTPSDLRESGSLEQDADQVLFLYRDVVYNTVGADPFAAELNVALIREGEPGMIPLRFIPTCTRFENPGGGNENRRSRD